MSQHEATLRVVDARRWGHGGEDRADAVPVQAGLAPHRSEDARRHALPPRLERDRRRPPSGARLLRVSRARSECPPGGASMPLGWTVILGAVVFLCVLGLGLLANAMPTTAPVPESTTVLWVRGGESLWEVAGRAAPDSDRDAVIDRIRELNGLGDALVRPGQPLTVPASG